MKIVLASERPTLIDVVRDSDPLPGEKPVERVLVDDYHSGRPPKVVGGFAHVSAPRLSQFLVEKSPEAERLVAALRQGPVEVSSSRPGQVVVDLDRISRPTPEPARAR